VADVGYDVLVKGSTPAEPEPQNDPDRTYFVVQSGVDCTKGSIGETTQSDYATCESACFSDDKCIGFQFIENCPIDPLLSTNYDKLPKVKYTNAYSVFDASTCSTTGSCYQVTSPGDCEDAFAADAEVAVKTFPSGWFATDANMTCGGRCASLGMDDIEALSAAPDTPAKMDFVVQSVVSRFRDIELESCATFVEDNTELSPLQVGTECRYRTSGTRASDAMEKVPRFEEHMSLCCCSTSTELPFARLACPVEAGSRPYIDERERLTYKYATKIAPPPCTVTLEGSSHAGAYPRRGAAYQGDLGSTYVMDGNSTRVTSAGACAGWEVQTSAQPLEVVLLQNCSNSKADAAGSYLAGKLSEGTFGTTVTFSLAAAEPGFSARSGHVAIVVGGHVLVIGGRDGLGGNVTSDVWISESGLIF
jgi:hypothetical protein